MTMDVMWEFLYFHGINFDIFSHSVRIVLAALYVIIMILAAILNFTILYVFIKQQKLRKPSNLVLSPLLWNSLLLLLTILPLTLLKICFEPVRTNRDAVAVHSYLTFFYIWLNFISVMHIALNRARIIAKNSFRTNQGYSWINIILLIITPVWSALAPLLMFLIYKYQGKDGVVVFTFSEFTFMSCTAVVSYCLIFLKVRKSGRGLKSFCQSSHLLHQQKKRLHKVKITVTLTIGGYLLTFTPFLCVCVIEIYSLYYKDFHHKNLLFIYGFRAVSEMILYLSSIINPFIYFYTQKAVRKEIVNLTIVRRVTIAVQPIKKTSLNEQTVKETSFSE